MPELIPSAEPLLTVSDLLARGWTDPMLRFLPPPVYGRHPRHPNSPKQVKLWPLAQVEAAESRPEVRTMQERSLQRRDRRQEKKRAGLAAARQHAFYCTLALEQAFDAAALVRLTEGDPTGDLLVRRLHQGILCAMRTGEAVPMPSLTEAHRTLRETLALTDARYSVFLKTPMTLARCALALGRGETKRERAMRELLTGEAYMAALVRTAAVILYEYDQRREKTTPLQLLSMPDFPAHKLLTSALYQIYLVDCIPSMIRTELSDLITVDPKDEYPLARMTDRRFHIHVGGTNTGKTYQSLQRLAQAESGVYLAPLRLLALEVQESLLSQGVNCSMLTGEEEDIRPGATHISSTVEKLDPSAPYAVAVIDECQMIADRERGFAWTRAILGCCAREIHLCTAPEGLDLLIRLIESCGEPYEIQHHHRMSRLTLEDAPITLDQVQDGDALISFSKRRVLMLAEELRRRGRPASVIYGALPYATRRLQMERFLRGETKLLVSTDAIGMGLNLPIRRIVFTRDRKFDGAHNRTLLPEEVKQIAGRAGRFGVYDEGFVTALMPSEAIRTGFTAEVPPIEQAVLGFSDLVLRVDHDLLEVLQVWNRIPAIAPYQKMSVDRYIFILKTLEEHAIELTREQSLRAATIPFDERDETLFDYFLLYCEQFVGGRTIDPPIQDARSLDGLELYSQQLDLYYSFCRAFRQPIDLRWLRSEKEATANAINDLLLRELTQRGRSCPICHAPMPLDSHFRICRRCAERHRAARRPRRH